MPLTQGARRRPNIPQGTDVNGGFRSLGSLVADLMREAAMRAPEARDELVQAGREMAIRQAVRRFTR